MAVNTNFVSQKRNLHLICRLCLQRKNGMVSIFRDTTLPARIKAIAPTVEIVVDDGLPSRICQSCLQKVNAAYYIKVQTETCNDILNARFNSDGTQQVELYKELEPLRISDVRSLMNWNNSRTRQKTRDSKKDVSTSTDEDSPQNIKETQDIGTNTRQLQSSDVGINTDNAAVTREVATWTDASQLDDVNVKKEVKEEDLSFKLWTTTYNLEHMSDAGNRLFIELLRGLETPEEDASPFMTTTMKVAFKRNPNIQVISLSDDDEEQVDKQSCSHKPVREKTIKSSQRPAKRKASSRAVGDEISKLSKRFHAFPQDVDFRKNMSQWYRASEEHCSSEQLKWRDGCECKFCGMRFSHVQQTLGHLRCHFPIHSMLS